MLYSMVKQSSLHAALIACVMVFFLGLGHRVLDVKYGNVERQRSVVDANALTGLPHTFGDWTGHDVPLDERIVEVADIDTYINRIYSRSDSERPIIFYIGCGSNPAVVSHRPDRCYLGSGWLPCVRRKGEISLSGGKLVPYNIYKYTRKDTTAQGITLFQLFVVDGDCYTATRQFWGSLRSASYCAQVQIGVRSDGLTRISDEDEEILTEFSKDALPHMNVMFATLLEERAGKEIAWPR
jgi:hypothetical protein